MFIHDTLEVSSVYQKVKVAKQVINQQCSTEHIPCVHCDEALVVYYNYSTLYCTGQKIMCM